MGVNDIVMFSGCPIVCGQTDPGDNAAVRAGAFSGRQSGIATLSNLASIIRQVPFQNLPDWSGTLKVRSRYEYYS